MDCKNCSNTLTDASDFCNSCGAKVIRNRLTVKNLFEHFSEQFLNYDNKFLQTFIHLFTRPEEVIGCYISGTRKKYVNAISYFAIAITLSGLQLYIINKFFPEAMDYSAYEAYNQEETIEINNQIMSITQEYQSLIMMFYIPFYALLSKIVFFNHKQFNYTEHLVIFLYAQAQISIFGFFFLLLMLLTNVHFLISSFIYMLLMFVYVTFVLKRMHGLNKLEMLLKTLIFILIIGVLFIVPVIGYGVYVGIQKAVASAG